MSDDTDFLAPPPFRPEAALQQLHRDLRSMGLLVRAGQFERRGIGLVRAATDGIALQVAVVKEPHRGAAWQAQVLRNGAELRAFVTDVRKRLARWSDQDD